MSKFIWVRDLDKRQHYLNVDYIIRVTKVPTSSGLKTPEYAYIVTADGKEFRLSSDEKIYDTYEEVISKIQRA